ncbi:hypothetical protein NL676_024179 [Syzygium grande]|nr:hypothetical protein NL676_024179 [Syzygium grande]
MPIERGAPFMSSENHRPSDQSHGWGRGPDHPFSSHRAAHERLPPETHRGSDRTGRSFLPVSSSLSVNRLLTQTLMISEQTRASPFRRLPLPRANGERTLRLIELQEDRICASARFHSSFDVDGVPSGLFLRRGGGGGGRLLPLQARAGSAQAGLAAQQRRLRAALRRMRSALVSGSLSQLLGEHVRSAYEDGTFCETYHSNADGWRNCNTCQKLLHCGCIMSVHAFVVLDFGGVSCMDCSRNDFIQDIPEAQQKLDESQAVGLSDGSVEVAAEIPYEVYVSATHARAVLHATPGETGFQNVISSAPCNESSPPTDYGVMISQNSYHGAEFKSPERFPFPPPSLCPNLARVADEQTRRRLARWILDKLKPKCIASVLVGGGQGS